MSEYLQKFIVASKDQESASMHINIADKLKEE